MFAFLPEPIIYSIKPAAGINYAHQEYSPLMIDKGGQIPKRLGD